MIAYTCYRDCGSFWTWLYCSWRVRKGWDGPSYLFYEVGTRICGFEFVHIEQAHHD